MKRATLAFLIPLMYWLAVAEAHEPVPMPSTSGPPTDGPRGPENGRAVMIDRTLGNCLACHQIPGLEDEPFHGSIGPSLAGVANRYSEVDLRLRVVDPTLQNSSTIMPAFYRIGDIFSFSVTPEHPNFRVMPEFARKPILTNEQVEDVVAFLLTLTDDTDTSLLSRITYDPGPIVRVQPPAGSTLRELVSGYYFRISETQEMQDDDFLNPGFLWVDRGRQLWNEAEGAAGKACADCHGEAEGSMRGVGAVYPKYRTASRKVVNLEQQINLCRREQMQAEPWEFGTDDLVAMTSYVMHQSRGMPVDVRIDGPAAQFFERGKSHFYQRRGQLNMSCAHCHTANHGKFLRGDLLSQGHTNGYPIYSLDDSSMLPLHKLFRQCNQLTRSVSFEVLSDEYVSLELFLAWRGQGLLVEAPGVR
jgi:sulfur-oxidizing protein SoxA